MAGAATGLPVGKSPAEVDGAGMRARGSAVWALGRTSRVHCLQLLAADAVRAMSCQVLDLVRALLLLLLLLCLHLPLPPACPVQPSPHCCFCLRPPSPRPARPVGPQGRQPATA